jgi:hypothetical protein
MLQGKSSGVQGLLHKSEMSWDLVWTVDEVVQTGEGCASVCGVFLCGGGRGVMWAGLRGEDDSLKGGRGARRQETGFEMEQDGKRRQEKAF